MLRRLVTTISILATKSADCETMKKQAESANAVARQLLEEKENKVWQCYVDMIKIIVMFINI